MPATQEPPTQQAHRYINVSVQPVMVYDDRGRQVQVWPWSRRGEEGRGSMPFMVTGEHYAQFARDKGGKGPLTKFPDADASNVSPTPRKISGMDSALLQQVYNLMGEVAPEHDVTAAVQFLMARSAGREIACPEHIAKFEQPLLHIARAISHQRMRGHSFDNTRVPDADENGVRWIRTQKQMVTSDSMVRAQRDSVALDDTNITFPKGAVSRVTAFDANAAPPRIRVERFPGVEFDALSFEVVQEMGALGGTQTKVEEDEEAEDEKTSLPATAVVAALSKPSGTTTAFPHPSRGKSTVAPLRGR